MMADGGSPCTEMSGAGDAPADPEPAALASSERFSVAIVEASPLTAGLGATASSLNARFFETVPTESPPLYLSHCAFLC